MQLSTTQIYNVTDLTNLLDTKLKINDINNTNNTNNTNNINETQKINNINSRIKLEFCIDICNQLKDINLIDTYKECLSVKNKIKKLISILEKNKIEDDKIKLITNDFLFDLIPAGTKGVIKGNKFNKIIKNKIEAMNLDKTRFEICFEKINKDYITSEIPDWYIIENNTKKIIIGMNQLDITSGGQQLNRGYKYLIDNKHNTEKSKLLCVICNYIQFKKNNKGTKLFEIGFLNDTLTYIKNLENIIKNFFNIQ